MSAAPTPIPGTNLLRCSVTLGREFQFPIVFAANKHFELTSTPSTITSYSRNLPTCLSALCEVAELLVKEQCAYQCEFVNLQQPDPKIYLVGDIVFAWQAVRSDGARGLVDKLLTHSLVRCTSLQNFMAHRTNLSIVLPKAEKRSTLPTSHPILPSLFLFQPLDDADNQYGQLY
jgi:hypothetical protein